MLKMEATSKKPPQQVIGQMKAYFGDGGLGLNLVDDTAGCLRFEGGGGHVAATLCSDHDLTRVILETREWEIHVRRFVQSLD
ncbi:hypothetical protein [Desulfosarcina sp.]|uniref:hypothetical protein n=1 Tax=Desulfosarcina sp. TaxID=2027861 RepID=UPI003970929D